MANLRTNRGSDRFKPQKAGGVVEARYPGPHWTMDNISYKKAKLRKEQFSESNINDIRLLERNLFILETHNAGSNFQLFFNHRINSIKDEVNEYVSKLSDQYTNEVDIL